MLSRDNYEGKGDNTLFLLLFIYLTFGLFLFRPLALTWVDEFFVFALLIIAIKRNSFCLFSNKGFKILCSTYIFYLVYSLCRQVNPTVPGILSDSFQQIKPFLFFYSAYCIDFNLSQHQQKILKQASLLYAILSFLILLAAGDIYYYYGHPSVYYSVLFSFCLFYFFCSKKERNNIYIALGIFALGIISEKSKYVGILICGIYFLLFLKERIKISPKYLLIAFLLFCGVIYFTWEKITIYYIEGADEENGIVRTLLYMKAPEIIRDYFPFGPGFCTYANFYSGEYYSPLYYDYGLNVWGLLEEAGKHNFAADTYYPQLAQYGIFGIILWIAFWKNNIRKLNCLPVKDEWSLYIFGLFISSFVLIECVASPCIQTNQGLIPFFFLAQIIRTSDLKYNNP